MKIRKTYKAASTIHPANTRKQKQNKRNATTIKRYYEFHIRIYIRYIKTSQQNGNYLNLVALWPVRSIYLHLSLTHHGTSTLFACWFKTSRTEYAQNKSWCLAFSCFSLSIFPPLLSTGVLYMCTVMRPDRMYKSKQNLDKSLEALNEYLFMIDELRNWPDACQLVGTETCSWSLWWREKGPASDSCRHRYQIIYWAAQIVEWECWKLSVYENNPILLEGKQMTISGNMGDGW